MEGKIKWYNDKKGYGFIAGSISDVFFHRTDMPKDSPPLKMGEAVTFEMGKNDRGDKAVNIKRTGG
jgi:CspA family cold shock protein